jgi:hypothetical protein
MNDVSTLDVVEALEVDPSEAIHEPHMAGLREKRVVVDESP